MPRRATRKEPSPPAEGYRVVGPEDPDAWPLLVAFDLE
jgi:magnesium-dependent phosphatase 1